MNIALQSERRSDIYMAGHEFGGEWTRRKLAIMKAYLEFYTKVLTQAGRQGPNFETWYIDAFAGTGDHKLTGVGAAMWDYRTLEEYEASFDVTMDGSARIALNIDPPFHHYRMIEAKKNHFDALQSLQRDFAGKDIQCIKGEANEQLIALFNSPPWKSHHRSRSQRAVVFLDPYGLNVKWSTLKTLADSEAADVWYFFNIGGLTRNCPHRPEALDPSKIATVTEAFGTDAWRTEFYRKDHPKQHSLFDNDGDGAEKRWVDKPRISAYATARLKDLFDYVSDPIELHVTGRGHCFSLYCMSNNQSKPAIDAIKRGVAHVRKLKDVKEPLPAFRQTSDPDTADQ
jgi:three-Cys-motif partner protein